MVLLGNECFHHNKIQTLNKADTLYPYNIIELNDSFRIQFSYAIGMAK